MGHTGPVTGLLYLLIPIYHLILLSFLIVKRIIAYDEGADKSISVIASDEGSR
jgi:hypothetical protein